MDGRMIDATYNNEEVDGLASLTVSHLLFVPLNPRQAGPTFFSCA
jgi:hypothetical protein